MRRPQTEAAYAKHASRNPHPAHTNEILAWCWFCLILHSAVSKSHSQEWVHCSRATVLGGDHSITFPVVRAYNSPLTVIFIARQGWERQMRKILAVVALVAMFTAFNLFGQTPPCPSPVNFAGIRTFLGAPYIPRLEDLKADIAVVGVPFDEGTWNAPGARRQWCFPAGAPRPPSGYRRVW